MNEIVQRIKLSDSLVLLSSELGGVGDQAMTLASEKSQALLRNLYRQIVFLMRFNYTRENIQNHLWEKAMRFFGLDWESERKVKSRRLFKKRGPKKRKKTHKTRLDQTGKTTIARKKRKKIEKNFYCPPG